MKGFPHRSVGKSSACNSGDLGSIPGSQRSPGEGNGNPLQYSCLENPMDRGAWQATVHGILQARILEWVAVPFSRGSSQPRDRKNPVSHIADGFFTIWATREVGCDQLLKNIFLLWATIVLSELPLWLSWQRIHLQFRRPGFNSWVGKIPWRREQLPTPVFWPGEFHGLYSPWGLKELDTPEWLSLSQFSQKISMIKQKECWTRG